MINIYRVSFIGHRQVNNLMAVEAILQEKIRELLSTKEFVEFQVGKDGEFDNIAASCIKRVQKVCGKQNSAITLVLPYHKANIMYYEKYYDSIIIPEEAAKAHFKSAITKRNQWLVNNCDLLIAFVQKEAGGAAACLKMAQGTGLEIFNIASYFPPLFID